MTVALYKPNFKILLIYLTLFIYYRVDDRGSIPGRGKGFSSSLCVETTSEAHPASYSMGTGGHFHGAKRDRDVTLTTHPI
jgi:hypothetical protein